jgi:glutamine---fructose-6-phosphate transaminase (isomerizing)
LTNDPESELGHAAEAVVSLSAGPERAVAATKTYVNQLAALALLAAAAGDRGREVEDAIRGTSALLAAGLDEMGASAADAARLLLFAGRMFAIGRGVEFATAREVALKLTETCRIAAEPLTTTDLSHGPVAALDALFPVWAVATEDPCLPTVLEATDRARASGSAVVASGNAAAMVRGAAITLPVPAAPLSVLSPLLSIVPGQLVAGALATIRGLDPDRPEGLHKVTLAA